LSGFPLVKEKNDIDPQHRAVVWAFNLCSVFSSITILRRSKLTYIRRALVSVSDKTGLVEFARALRRHGVEIISTGGTAAFLKGSDIPVADVSDYTGFPEILDGRVKTLHPKIHGGLLAIRGKPEHEAQRRANGIEEIDMVVVNLYPFRETAARANVSFADVIENIDIGGPSMVRSAAKNHASVAVVVDPYDYGWIAEELASGNGSLGSATLFKLAQKAFVHTAAYDSAIAAWLSERVWTAEGATKAEQGLPRLEILSLEKVQDLRYGENPHQHAAVYRRSSVSAGGAAGADLLHGKELSYNNLLDADAAWNLVQEFDRPAAAVIKHTNPSGVAQADSLREAYVLARDCDPVSAFGSVVALNRPVDSGTAVELSATFVEVILAGAFDENALAILGEKKNLRLMRMNERPVSALQLREIGGGFLVQDRDLGLTLQEGLKIVTRRRPSDEEMKALLFGWKVVKHVKSNAIVFSDASRTLGIGAGQMSRVDAVKWGAQRALLPLQGCVMASDAFFPFPDGVIAAAGFGVRAIIQPGGSLRDAEVIAAADEHDMAMVFTGMRHFRH
jgi:phosphoribosylaminoimidazolecarboxamide formyltransferase/IMP cyclohydrolase